MPSTTTEDKTLRLAEHTETPGGRYRADGPHSAEWFREDLVSPVFEAAVREGVKLRLDLSDVYGLPASFLEEVFGGLRRKYGREQVNSTLAVEAKDDPRAVRKIVEFIGEDDVK